MGDFPLTAKVAVCMLLALKKKSNIQSLTCITKFHFLTLFSDILHYIWLSVLLSVEFYFSFQDVDSTHE